MEKELYMSGKSLTQVSEETGIPISTLRFRFKKEGILRTRSEGICLAASDGRLGSGNRGKKRVFTKEWKDNISKARTGIGKGVSLKSSGYLEVTIGEHKGRCQHVVVMEEHIGRRLFHNECVHHIDRDKTNNKIENLQLMTKTDHSRLHAIENLENRKRDKKGRFK